MFDFIKKWFKPTDDDVIQNYLKMAIAFGDVASYLFLEEIVCCKYFKNWKKTEAALIKAGYHSMDLDDLIAFGGYGMSLEQLNFPRKILEGEEVIHYAVLYEKCQK